MNKRDVADLFKFLRSIYPNFDVDQHKIDTWEKMLKDQNPANVMKKAEHHAMDNPFPPTIADLRTNKRNYDTNILEQLKKWEEDASGKPTYAEFSLLSCIMKNVIS